jgi:protein-tyrosine phosphatase
MSHWPQSHHDDQFNFLNFRDVGEGINSLTGASTLRLKLLYRSARPDSALVDERSLLRTKFGVKTIIDLRSRVECINIARANCYSSFRIITDAVFSPILSSSKPWPSPENNLYHILDITYTHIPLDGSSLQRYLIWSLSWLSLIKLLFFFMLGCYDSALAILGREAITPQGLVGFCREILDRSTNEIKSCFDTLCNPGSYPVLVHCTQGKDRTGLVILLVLLLCEVPCWAAEKEYAVSETELEPNHEERLRYLTTVGLNESFAGCPGDFVEKIIEHLDKRHGGVVKYLTKIGVDSKAQKTIKGILLE